MRDAGFEWDDAKAAQNIRKHGVAFEAAKEVFDDPFALESVDSPAIHEDRFRVVGMSENRLLLVVYTTSGERIRIISARLAEPLERRRYHEQSSQDPI